MMSGYYAQGRTLDGYPAEAMCAAKSLAHARRLFRRGRYVGTSARFPGKDIPVLIDFSTIQEVSHDTTQSSQLSK